jgi:hypothetical protein
MHIIGMASEQPSSDTLATARAPIYQPIMPAATRYTGEVVYIFAYDVAYDMTRQPITTLMGQPVSQFAVDTSKRNPRSAYFYRSQSVRLPDVERMSPRGLLRMRRSVKILPVGAISITIRIPFEIESLETLVALHDLKFTDGRYLREDVRDWAEEIRKELRPYAIRPHSSVGEDEAYTVFCIDAPLKTPDGKLLSGEDWLRENRRGLAALLTEEDAPENLSDQEAEESTGRYLSYYDQDLSVVDWDAALIVDEPRYRDEIIYIMELANLQLAELEAYDRLLDTAVESLYRDLGSRRFRRLGFRIEGQLQELRVDMARVTDELSNITKFFGDWHLARIYQLVSSRFHLSDWHRTVDDKLKTIDEIYQLLRSEQNNRLMLTLEIMIVILFIVDVVMLFIRK